MAKYLIIFLCFFITSKAGAQQNDDSTKYIVSKNYWGFKYNRFAIDSGFYLPRVDTNWTPFRRGAVIYRKADNLPYIWNGNKWATITTGGGSTPTWEQTLVNQSSAFIADHNIDLSTYSVNLITNNSLNTFSLKNTSNKRIITLGSGGNSGKLNLYDGTHSFARISLNSENGELTTPFLTIINGETGSNRYSLPITSGTLGQVLTSQGNGNSTTWETISGAGLFPLTGTGIATGNVTGDLNGYKLNITGGNVGIGTATPSAALDVVGEASISSQMTIGTHLYGGSSDAGSIFNFNGGGSTSFKVSGSNAEDLIELITPTLYLDKEGHNAKFGINTTSPSVALDVVGEFKLANATFGSGKVLTSDLSGNATWQTPSGGTVTSIATGLGISGGTITTSGTLLVDTASASILSRQRAANTYGTISNLALKVNISDTSSMLANYLRSNIASATYQVPITAGDVTTSGATSTIGAAKVSVSKMSLPSYSFAANNTNATAAPTAFTYKAPGVQTYTGTVTWTGSSAPSGTTNITYDWVQIGNQVNVTIWAAYTGQGNFNTQVDFTFPTDMPAPIEPAGLTATNDIIATGVGSLNSSSSNLLTTARHAYLIKTGTGTYKISVVAPSTQTRVATANIVYYTN